MLSDFLKLSDRIWVLPVIHGSGDFAIEVRRVMLADWFNLVSQMFLSNSFGRTRGASQELSRNVAM